MEKLTQTLCFVRDGNRVLLGMKQVRLGAGKWNGFGGKVEPGESIEAAAMRETKEESGISVSDIEKCGVLQFKSPNRPDIEMHIFSASEFTGEPTESDEMRPQWFEKDTIPFRDMWSDDLYWWPLFWKNRKFVGSFEFDTDDRVISHEVKVVDTLQ